MQGKFPVTKQGLAAAQAALATHVRAAGVASDVAHRAAVILDEVCANMMRHDATLSEASCFMLDVSMDVSMDDVMRIVISDPGAPFDPVSHVSVATDGPGGHGIAIIKAMSVGVEYVRRDGQNQLTIDLALPSEA